MVGIPKGGSVKENLPPEEIAKDILIKANKTVNQREEKMKNIISGILGNTLRRYLIMALAGTLAVTSGMFAYAYTTTSTNLSVTGASSSFADVTANMTVPSFTAFGSYRGAISAGNLFNITPAASYPGDLEINVYLNNIDDLSYKYGMILMNIKIADNAGNFLDAEGITKPLTLQNGVVSFVSTSSNFTAGTDFYVQVDGGVYRAFPWAYLSGVTGSGSWAPSITCEVLQAGL